MSHVETPPPRKHSIGSFALAGCLGALVGAAGLLAALLGAYYFFNAAAVQKMAETKELKPVQLRADYDWTLRGVDGTNLDMTSLQGKPVFLHVWRPGCVSCVAEVPGLNALYATFQSKGVVFVTIALDASADDLVGDLQMNAVEFPVYTVEGDTLPAAFSATSTPTTWIINRKGFIVYSHAGAVDWDAPDGRDFLEYLSAE